MKVIALRNCPAKTTADFSPQTSTPAFSLRTYAIFITKTAGRGFPVKHGAVARLPIISRLWPRVADHSFVRFCIAAPDTFPAILYNVCAVA